MNNLTVNRNIAKSVTSGGLRPHQWLTNISVAYFQDQNDFITPSVFPIIPVDFSTGHYSIFSKADLNRDNFERKPEFGHVNPTVLATEKGSYDVKVDQMILGLDKIQEENFRRLGRPGVADPRIAQAKTLAYQTLLHLDNMFAKNFFKEGVWNNELTGQASAGDNVSTFMQLSNDNSEPIKFIQYLKRQARRQNTVTPNVMLCGVDAFDALINHRDIVERIKMGGSSTNPAVANEQTLAQIFGLNSVHQMQSTINAAEYGLDEDMQYICDPKSILLVYANPNPQIDSPSAGYTFSWDPTGNGQPIVVSSYEGHPADHSSFIEGLTAFDMKPVCKDLGIFLTNAV